MNIRTSAIARPWTADFVAYVRNIRDFNYTDWLLYLGWIGSLVFLFVGTTAFIVSGHLNGIAWPGYVWFIPTGVGMFMSALAIDDIGHRTLYKHEVAKGEAYVHRMIAATAIPSVMAMCLGFDHPETFRMPALSLIGLSLFFSAIDEFLHWQRYLRMGIDRVEVWSHFVAITGHVLMISCWWQWYTAGYPGVAEYLQLLSAR